MILLNIKDCMKKLINNIKKLCPQGIHNFISDQRLRKKILLNERKYKSIISKTQQHYKEIENTIKTRNDKILRFASYVIFDSSVLMK